jgi:hypothetical protein
MMDQKDIDEKCTQFLTELYDQTKGDSQIQISMYDIGTAMGLGKNISKQLAEELIGLGMVEIRTLSGGISITESGVGQVQNLRGDEMFPDAGVPILGDDPILEDKVRQGVEAIIADLKKEVGNLCLEFDLLSELVADLKTIDIQLTSSRPKTAIVRECFCSIKTVLEKAGTGNSLIRVSRILGLTEK